MRKLQSVHLTTLALLAAASLGAPAIARAADITSGLAGHWTFDEGSGAKAADSSGNGRHAILTSRKQDQKTWEFLPEAAPENWIAEGKVGGALKLTGGFVHIPYNEIWELGGSSTIALWCRMSGGNNGYMLCHGKGGWAGWVIVSYHFTLCAGSSEARQSFDFPGVPADTWTHLAVVLDRGLSPNRASIYVNGKLAPNYPQDMKPGVGGDDVKGPLWMGGRGDVGDVNCAGMFDDVRIYTRALSADDVAQLAQYTGKEKIVGWQGRIFQEDASANDGSITNTVTAKLVRARFAPPKGVLKEDTHYTAKNIPPGLSLQVELASDTEVIVSLKGKAAGHKSGDGKDIQLEFLDAAFAGGGAADILGRSTSLGVKFAPNAAMNWSADAFCENTEADDGSMAGPVKVTLKNDKFALPAGALTEGTHYTAKNVPEGLKLEIAVVSATEATLSLSGKAAKHLGRDSVDNLQVRFFDAAFAGKDALDVVDSSRTLPVLFSGTSPEQAAANLAVARELRELTGAPARLVWAQQAFKTVADPYGWGSFLYLMGLDTEDGKGIRRILPETGPYGRPALSPDGQRVYYGDRTGQKTYVVDFKGGTPRLVTDKSGHVHSIVRDAAGAEWVYATLPSKEEPLVRFEAKSGRMETVWDKGAANAHHLQVSPDGRKVAIAVGGRNNGVLDIPSGEFTELSAGCWPAMLPGTDPYRVSIFQGSHADVKIFENPGDAGKSQRNWKVAIPSPVMGRGVENMHPRWSNRDRFMVMTSPYKAYDAGGLAVYDWTKAPYIVARGGNFVQVCVGRLGSDLSNVEKWVQITSDKTDSGGNWNPDLWIKP